MKKKHSITGRDEIRGLYREGRFFSAGCLLFRFLANDSGFPRFVISVSRKVSKKAVVRNRLKRVIRAAFRNDPVLMRSGVNAAVSVVPGRSVAKTEYRVIGGHLSEFARELNPRG